MTNVITRNLLMMTPDSRFGIARRRHRLLAGPWTLDSRVWILHSGRGLQSLDYGVQIPDFQILDAWTMGSETLRLWTQYSGQTPETGFQTLDTVLMTTDSRLWTPNFGLGSFSLVSEPISSLFARQYWTRHRSIEIRFAHGTWELCGKVEYVH